VKVILNACYEKCYNNDLSVTITFLVSEKFMSNLLKGNFTTKKQVEAKQDDTESTSLQSEFKKAALNSIGGSMVYVERTDLTWSGDDEDE